MIHTMTIGVTITVDIVKLIRFANKRMPRRILISSINIKGLDRSHWSGFSKRRFREADTSYPLIINQRRILLDGRHRLFKLKDQGRKYANAVIVTDDEIDRCCLLTSPASLLK